MEFVDSGGARIPKLGLGTWKNTGAQCTDAVRTALELGYRHVDTAQAYDNERAVGEGIAAANVDREDVFLTTKVWRSNLAYDDVHTSVRESLDRLGTEYVDLLLIHWPHSEIPVEETLEAMMELRDADAVKHIGVSNFTISQLKEAMDLADEPIVTDQVLYHPFKDQSDLHRFCVEHTVALTAYSPLARGEVVNDELLERIGARYDKTSAQVALRWLIQQEGVVVIPKATSERHLEENGAIFDFSLTDEEMGEIRERSGGLEIQIRNQFPEVVRRLGL